ncbi:hypothetical protein [Flavobacterium sp.]|jgi:YD repeat-containing protein|uniref:hypothetical protein n=1 Tax=Flavobacterium sp. TaxID=239 RepID=UPI0037C109C7
MRKHQKRQRFIATFFLLIFFPTLVPTNLFASNNGPKSPEAASFEPVDATDMVNLLTGQYSYVLPLLNVPSPEGGYPLALGYHAGIAMDQESSWTGLGWNVNPGAIDRSINGYPDDYNASHLNEYFYDSGGEAYASFVSVGYSVGVASVGLGFNWGSNQSLGGFVSTGVGFDIGGGNNIGVNSKIGTSGASVGVGVQFAGGLSVGVEASTDGIVGGNIGFDSNGAGFSMGYDSSGTFSQSMSGGGLGISMVTSSKGLRASVKAGGVGFSTSFNNTLKMGEYSTSTSGWVVPLSVPTPIGIFSLSFGKQTFKYWLAKNKDNYVTGPLYFQNGVKDIFKQKYIPPYIASHTVTYFCYWTPSNQTFCTYNPITSGPHSINGQHHVIATCSGNVNDGFPGPHTTSGHWIQIPVNNAFMDINETSIEASNLASSSNFTDNNMSFPNYDNFNIQAQGLSGSMSSPIYKNGALIGLTGNENNQGYALKYNINGSSPVPDYAKFNEKPKFYLENEISTYINVLPANYNATSTNSDILNYYVTGSVDLQAKPRRKTSSFIEYYSNDEIVNNITVLKQNGYLQPSVSGFDRSIMPKEGVGAYKITAIDGKTYHYSLPVYNHEIITRTSGVVSDNRQDESQSYMEKRQLEPYATHWLLTAVTGPDFVDNGDGIPSDGDLGYWTSFEYGKWTDGFIWKAPYKKEYIRDDNNPKIKTWIRGRKQLYYLDKVKTRTHTALFVKSQRTDAASENWIYNSVNHLDDNSGNYSNQFTVPSQNQLRLDKIILLKNQDDTVDKTFGLDSNQSVTIGYVNSDKTSENAKYNLFDNIIDYQDNWQSSISKAIKVIDFGYDYSLVPGDNRLTLKNVNFKGKSENNILPPYQFEYNNSNSLFNIDDNDGWGYNSKNSSLWSLSKIITPLGGQINIEYESNICKSITNNKFDFNSSSGENVFFDEYINPQNKLEFKAKLKYSFGIDVGSIVQVSYQKKINYGYGRQYLHTPSAVVTQDLGNNVFRLVSTGPIHTEMNSPVPVGNDIFKGSFTLNRYQFEINQNAYNLISSSIIRAGGVRASKISIVDANQTYYTEYKYGNNEDGVGYVSYVPFAPHLNKELPYSSELPAPRVMYDCVTIKSSGNGLTYLNKSQYKFNTLKPINQISGSGNLIKYGDFYEITKNVNTHSNSTAYKAVSVGSFTVKDNLASIGQLLEVKTFNSQGQMMSKISNDYYKTTDVIPNNLGVTQESYQSYKTVDYTVPYEQDKWLINSSTRIKYPNLIKSSTEQKDGYTYTTEFKDYDLISGVAKETWSTSSDGKSLKTKIIPAYTKYPQMGSKVDDITNRNMLSQTAAEYSYQRDAAGNDRVTGVGITTWSNIWSYKDIAGATTSPTLDKEKIWRKHKSYTWNGVVDSEGYFPTTFNSATDDGFVWGVGLPQTNSKWKQISEVTLYDHYSAPIEMKDINNNFASTKMGDNDTKVMTTGNAGYNEMYYAGGENIDNTNTWLEPEVKGVGITRDVTKYHTGKYSIATTSTSQFGVDMKATQHRAGKYKLSVWVHNTNAAKARVNVGGGPVTFNGESVTAGNWTLKTHYFNVTSAAIMPYVYSVDGTTVYYDDLMVRPVASSITGYVYNEWDELTYIIGNNGLATKYEYDAAGRLVRTSVEVVDDVANGLTGGFKKVSENTIKYKNLP